MPIIPWMRTKAKQRCKDKAKKKAKQKLMQKLNKQYNIQDKANKKTKQNPEKKVKPNKNKTIHLGNTQVTSNKKAFNTKQGTYDCRKGQKQGFDLCLSTYSGSTHARETGCNPYVEIAT